MKLDSLLLLVALGPAPLPAQQTRATDVIQRLYRDADSRGPLPVLRSGKWGYIDPAGATVISSQFDEAGFFYEGRAAVRLNGVWGYVDTVGTMAIPFRFTLASRFSDGLAHVRWRDDPAGATETSAYVDATGQVVFKCEGGNADIRLTAARCGRSFSGGFVAEAVEVFRCVDAPGNPKEYPCKASLIDRWGYYDKSGKLAIAGPFHSGGSRFVEGLAAATRYGEKVAGFIDSSGSFVVAPRFEQARSFSDGLAAVRVGGRWGFIDHSGRTVVEPRFQSVQDFSQDRAVASLDGQRGYIDGTGQFAIAPGFDDAAPFSEGLAAVCCDGERTRYIGLTGRWAFEASFPRGLSNVGLFIEGIALVDLSGVGLAYLDRTGRVVARVRDRN